MCWMCSMSHLIGLGEYCSEKQHSNLHSLIMSLLCLNHVLIMSLSYPYHVLIVSLSCLYHVLVVESHVGV